MTRAADKPRERFPIVVAGHVDHGKSTVVGRLLADAGGLPQGKLDQIRNFCAARSKPFEYAFLLDALKDEQNRGITIAAARVFFRTALRDYLIIDVPGHVEFVRNMVSGASHAAAALLVIDAAEGVRENSKRHGYLLSMLGVSQIVVLVNKMDRAGYQEKAFQSIAADCKSYLSQIGIRASYFIPTAALQGENVAARSRAMPWYRGPTVLEALDRFKPEAAAVDQPFRMPVQDVYKFTAFGDDRRIVAGTAAAGSLKAGDEVVFYPSGKTSVVKSLEGFPVRPAGPARAGDAVGFTLEQQIYVPRGQIAALRGQPRPQVAKRIRAGVFWLGEKPLRKSGEYLLKLGTARVRARLEKLSRVLEASTLKTLKGRDFVGRYEAAECVFALDEPLAFERAKDIPALGRFVLVDDFEISGGGLALEGLKDRTARAWERVIRRNIKWRKSFVSLPEREKRLGQRSGLILVTGSDDERRKAAAKELERRLFKDGRFVYFLGIGSVLYGVAADIRDSGGPHEEDIRRLAEVANILLDAGLILVVTASRLRPEDLDLILTAVRPSQALTAWIGPRPEDAPACDLTFGSESALKIAERIQELMARREMLQG